MTTSENKAERDNWTDHWTAYSDTANQNPAQELRHSTIISVIENISSDIESIIDIGSGQGDFLKKVSKKRLANELIGFELSATGVDISKEKVPEGKFYQVDMFNPPDVITDYIESFDVAVCSDVIEHVDNPVDFLKRASSYIKTGGRLIITVPGGPMSAFDHHIGHRMHYDQFTIRHVLESAGFSVDKIQLLGFPFFNLYRLAVILRGKKLITDVSSEEGGDSPNTIALIMMKMFGILFKFNLSDSKFGWQVFAVARKVDT